MAHISMDLLLVIQLIATRPSNGESGRVFSNQVVTGMQVNDPRYPGEIKMQFKPPDN